MGYKNLIKNSYCDNRDRHDIYIVGDIYALESFQKKIVLEFIRLVICKRGSNMKKIILISTVIIYMLTLTSCIKSNDKIKPRKQKRLILICSWLNK